MLGAERTPDLEEPTWARSARRRRRGLWIVLLVLVSWIGIGAVVVGDRPAPEPEFAFLDLAADGSPVAYPCGPIGYVVRSQGAPEDWPVTVARAVEAVEEASGYDLVDRTSAARPGSEGPVVFIRWGDADTEPSLAGTVVGRGGSDPTGTSGDLHYERGAILLDTTGYGTYDAADRRVTLMHELGHVLGLDHVASPYEIMAPGETRRETDTFGPGDRIGFARLRDASC